MKFALNALMAVLVLVCSRDSFARDDAVNSVMKLVPADAPAAIVIPSLKKLNDQLTQMLEGMDRANLLVGSRPIDQLKSITGFNIAVNDYGGAAIVIVNQNDQPMPVVLVPVTDAQSFLNGNLKPQGDLAYALPDGKIVYAKPLNAHVALASSEALIRAYQAPDDSLAKLQSALGPRTMPLLGDSDAFIAVRGDGIRLLRRAVEQAVGENAAQIVPAPLNALLDAEAGLTAFDLDPLGLVIRQLVAYRSDSVIGQSARQRQSTSQGLNALPNKPFYVAAAIEMQALGGAEGLHHLLGTWRMGPMRSLLDHVSQIQFAAYPSPAGAAGGLLNDSTLVLRTSDPAALSASIKQLFLDFDKAKGGATREVKWEDAKNVEGVGDVQAFELKTVNATPELALQVMFEQVIFGRAGIRGFVHTTADAVIVIFSQRPAVLKSAIEAYKNPASTLASSPVLTSIQTWLPANRDVKVYLGIGELARMIQQVATAFGAGDQVQWPELDANLPPIAFAADVIDRGAESAIVVPSSVLALLIDQAIANASQRANQEPVETP